MNRLTLAALALLFGLSLAQVSDAQADESASLTIKSGQFSPSTLAVKAGAKIKLSITNTGTKPAEFESAELNREKVIAPGSTATIYIGPLEPGSYPFFDDFNQAARGRIIAK